MTLQGFVTCARGTEEAVEKELQLLKATSIEKNKGFLSCKATSFDHLAKIAYQSQTASRVGVFLGKTTFKEATSAEALAKQLPAKELVPWFKNQKSKVVCHRVGKHNFDSKEIEEAFGGCLVDAEAIINLSKPDMILYIHLFEDEAFWGVDICGFDLGKRQYKVYNHPSALRGNLLSSVLGLADVEKNHTIIDPYCKEGSLLIEAALFASGKSPHFFEKELFLFSRSELLKEKVIKSPWEKEQSKTTSTITGFDESLKNIKATKANAKIAGVKDCIEVSKLQVDWLETKFEKGSVDRIVTLPPQYTKYADTKKVTKALNEFFYQAEFILKKKGKLACIVYNVKDIEELAEKYLLVTENIFEIYAGVQKLFVLVLTKK